MFPSSLDPTPTSIRPTSIAQSGPDPEHSPSWAHDRPQILSPSLISPDRRLPHVGSPLLVPANPPASALTPDTSPPFSAVSSLALPLPLSRPPSPSLPAACSSSSIPLIANRKPSMAAPIAFTPVIKPELPSTPPLAETLPRSMQGLKSFGGSTVRPPLPPASLEYGPGAELGRDGSLLGVGNSPGTWTVRAGSAQRHLMEYQVILHNLPTEAGSSKDESETIKADTACNELGDSPGVIRIGDAEIPRMIDLTEGYGEGLVGSLKQSRRVGLCWYCQNELPTAFMVKLPVESQEPQWVCRGCDARPARLE